MPPVLQMPDISHEFTVVCDASDIAISAVLHQKQGEGLAPVAYSSLLLSPTERRYSTHEKECLTVVCTCEKYCSYLEHTEFFLHMDNEALAWLLQHATELGQIWQCVLHLAPFKFKVCHVSGKTDVVADCLTR
jgi:hypothetical protein